MVFTEGSNFKISDPLIWASRNTAARLVLNPWVQVVALPSHQAFRRTDLHNSELEDASGVTLSAQEHVRLAGIPGSEFIICQIVKEMRRYLP